MCTPLPEMTCGFLIQLQVFCKKKKKKKKKKTKRFIGIEVEQETGAPPPKKNPGSAPVNELTSSFSFSVSSSHPYKFLCHTESKCT